MEETKLKLTQRNMPTLVTALTLTDVTLSTGKKLLEVATTWTTVFYKVDATTVNQEDFSTKIGLNSLQSDGSVDSIGNYSYTLPAVRVF